MNKIIGYTLLTICALCIVVPMVYMSGCVTTIITIFFSLILAGMFITGIWLIER
jgi:hypothetical protein